MKILLLLTLTLTLSAQEPRRFGWLGDSGQKRVMMLAPHQWAKTVPDAKSDLTAGLPPVMNQQSLGSCVSMGVAAAWSYAHNAQTGDHLPVSRLMIYYEARKAIGTVSYDSGSQIVDAVNWMSRWGSCKEPLWPYDISKFKIKAPNAAYTEAKGHRAIQAFKVDNTDRQSIRLALSNGYPVIVGSLVYNGIMQLNSRNYTLPMPGRGERPIGGHCMKADTKIPLLNGQEATIKELAEGRFGDSFWVYSCKEDGTIVPGLAHSARLTKSMAPTVKVTLDDGSSFECTPDHPIMLRDGSYVEAGQLSSGASLMPLYRRIIKKGEMRGYEQCLNGSSRSWRFTHRLVASEEGPYEGVVHHDDFKKRNNDPTNLKIMTWEDHTKLHAETPGLLQDYAKSEGGRAKSRELMQRLWSDPVWAAAQKERLRATARERGLRSAALGKTGLQTISKERLREVCRKNGKLGLGRKFSQETIEKRKQTKRLRWEGDLVFREKMTAIAIANLPKNHKVASVETSDPGDVYDMSVEKYHNFALSSGVFVHNCYLLVGHDDQTRLYLARNSWGRGWGRSGSFLVPADYIHSGRITEDCWVIVGVSPH